MQSSRADTRDGFDVAQFLGAYLIAAGFVRELPYEFFQLLEGIPTEKQMGGQALERMNISRRTVGRYFKAAGLPEPRSIFAFARLLWAINYAQCRHLPVSHAAAAAGKDPFAFSNQMMRFTGVRPTKAVTLTLEQLTEKFLERETGRISPTSVARPDAPAPANENTPADAAPSASPRSLRQLLSEPAAAQLKNEIARAARNVLENREVAHAHA